MDDGYGYGYVCLRSEEGDFIFASDGVRAFEFGYKMFILIRYLPVLVASVWIG